MAIMKNILEAIGNTPLVEIEPGIYAKCEFMNPSGSLKARLAKYMIERAEREGRLKPGDTIVESTSGALGGPIYAGTNEIQRNIIAERLLGLPREPK